jgi:hypothetical protein
MEQDASARAVELKSLTRVLPHNIRSVDMSVTDGPPGPSNAPSTPDINVAGLAPSPEETGLPSNSKPLFFGTVLQAVLLRSDYKQSYGPSDSDYRLRVGDRGQPEAEQANNFAARTFVLPSSELANRLQDVYFTHRWPALPLLHRPSFLEHHYAPVMTLEQKASDVSLFLTFMVFALGAIDLKLEDPSFPDRHLEYFNIATQNYLDGVIRSESIETVQGLLLMALFAVYEQNSVNSWHCIGQAVRMAIDLGLHHSSSSANGDLLTIETRKRVFWSAYALDRNISISLGRPCAIRDADIYVPLPQSYTDEELVPKVLSSSTPQSSTPSPSDMSTFIHTIKLRQIQSRIQDIFYPADTSKVTRNSLEYNRQLLRKALDDWVAKAPRYSKPPKTTFQTPDWFQIAYSHALLLLYRPSPAAPYVDLEGLQICADSAISLISSYSSLYAKNKITYTWIALHSLFMASVTMLYTLWVSPEIRRSTRKTVVAANVRSCLALFDVMGDYWPLAKRCYTIINRLGDVSIALFDESNGSESANTFEGITIQGHFGQIDAEYMEWFGTRVSSRLPLSTSPVNAFGLDNHNVSSGMMHSDVPGPLLDQMDFFPNTSDWFQQGFDMTIPIMTNAFSNDPYSNLPTGHDLETVPTT